MSDASKSSLLSDMSLRNTKKKSSPSFFAKKIASKLGQYLIVDEGQIHSNLMHNAKISLHDVQLKPQTIKDMFVIRGSITFIEFKWTWVKSNKIFQASITNAILTIKGVKIHVDLNMDQNTKESQQEENTGTGTHSNTQEGWTKSILKDILNILRFRLDDISVIFHIPISSEPSRVQDISICCDVVDLTSLGRKTKNGKHETEAVKILSKSMLYRRKPKQKKRGSALSPILQHIFVQRFQIFMSSSTSSLEEAISNTDFESRTEINCQVEDYSTAIDTDTIPLMDPFSYGAKILRFRGERFDGGIHQGVIFEGDPTLLENLQQLVDLNLLQSDELELNTVKKDGVNLSSKSENTISSRTLITDFDLSQACSSTLDESVEVLLMTLSPSPSREDCEEAVNLKSTDSGGSHFSLHFGPDQAKLFDCFKNLHQLLPKEKDHKSPIVKKKKITRFLSRKSLMNEMKQDSKVSNRRHINQFSRISIPLSSFIVQLPNNCVLKLKSPTGKYNFDGTKMTVSGSNGIFLNDEHFIGEDTDWIVDFITRELKIKAKRNHKQNINEKMNGNIQPNTTRSFISSNGNIHAKGNSDSESIRKQKSTRRLGQKLLKNKLKTNHKNGTDSGEDECMTPSKNMTISKDLGIEFGAGARELSNLINDALSRKSRSQTSWSLSFEGNAEIKF